MVAARELVVTEGDLATWCESTLGSRPTTELFRSGHLSVVVGLRLGGGREVVVKVRSEAPRLVACVAVQRHLHAGGFPCPEPLTDVVPFGRPGLVATAEALMGGEAWLPAAGRHPGLFAGWFAELLRLSPSPDDLPSLEPAPPWTGWSHSESGLWPTPDDRDVDLNAVDGPAWLDDAGRRARERLMRSVGRRVVGHGDYYAGNLRWDGDRLVVVHDWDSVIADTEAALVGFAAAVYPTTRAGTEATVEETDAFLGAYEQAAGRRFSPAEREAAWAAGVWLRAFDAKNQHAVGQPVHSLTEEEAAIRLDRAGAP